MKIKRKDLTARRKSAFDAAVTEKKDAAEIAKLKAAYAEANLDMAGKEDEEIDDPDIEQKKAPDAGDEKTVTGTELEALVNRAVTAGLKAQLPENLKGVLKAEDVKRIVTEVLPKAAVEGKAGVPVGDVVEICANVLAKCISDMTKQKSKMLFGGDDGSIELGADAWTKGNLPIHGKQLLNCLMFRPMNEGIDEAPLRKAMAIGDKMFERAAMIGVKALTSTGAATGDEWVPTDLSSVLLRRVYLESVLAQLMMAREIAMPTNPYEMPLSTTRPTFKLNNTENDASSFNTGSVDTRSTPGTGKPVLTAKRLMGKVEYSYEVEEDAIIPILATIQMLIGEAGAYALETAILNGDTTATHQDTDTAATANAVEKAFDGFRKLALANAATKLDMSTGGITRSNLVALKKKGKKYMRKPSELAWIVSTNNENDVLNLDEVALWKNRGETPTLTTGEVRSFLGIPIVVSEAARDDLNAVGVNDGITTTKGGVILANLNRFLLGSRRGFTVEVDKDITNQTKFIVASFRKAFTPIEAPSATVPSVVYGYNFTS
jgi:HK97 family phage major capsid protein